MLPRDPDIAQQFQHVSVEEWRRAVEQDLGGAPFEKRLVTHTYEGIYVRPLYTRADAPGGARGDAGMPGVPPFTRGGAALGTSTRGWDIRQERAEADAADLNAAILDDLTHGVTSVLLRLDAAAREGLDPDDPRAAMLAGVDGAVLPTIAAWRRAFRDVHLQMIGVAIEPGASFGPAAAMLAALWEETGTPTSEARGCFGADPIAVAARDGGLPYELERGMSLAAELAAWTDARFPHVRAVRVGTAAYHHAGATATQDLAFSMGSALEYLRAMSAAGMSVERAARQMLFSYAVGTQTFLAIAKLRAARRLWARVVEACGGGDDARRMCMHVRPSRRVWTAHDPWVNLLRNTACVFAAGVAGADAVGSVPLDAALGHPSGLARRIARNTQVILQEESHLHRVADPAGGSWYVESLTEDLARGAWAILQAIESRGGFIACLRSGWIRQQVEASMAQRARNIATRKDAITGVSEFPSVSEAAPPRPPTNGKDAARRAGEGLRAAREGAAKASASQLDKAGASTGAARFDALTTAARSGATLGQLAAAAAPQARESVGAPIAVHPYAEAFERLREASDRHLAQCGHRPRVFLASMGPIAEHTARTTYAHNFFEAGGFEVVESEGFADVDAALRAFVFSHAAIAVICSSDQRYASVVPELAPALHRAGARTVILAGNPGTSEAAYRAAGVDRFIFVRCDVAATLAAMLQEEGVLS